MTDNRDESIKMNAEWTEVLELTDKYMETNTTILICSKTHRCH